MIESEFLPDEVVIQEPSKLKVDDCRALMTHWRKREEDGLPAFRFARVPGPNKTLVPAEYPEPGVVPSHISPGSLSDESPSALPTVRKSRSRRKRQAKKKKSPDVESSPEPSADEQLESAPRRSSRRLKDQPEMLDNTTLGSEAGNELPSSIVDNSASDSSISDLPHPPSYYKNRQAGKAVHGVLKSNANRGSVANGSQISQQDEAQVSNGSDDGEAAAASLAKNIELFNQGGVAAVIAHEGSASAVVEHADSASAKVSEI